MIRIIRSSDEFGHDVQSLNKHRLVDTMIDNCFK